jgi:hypothetical protein
MAPSDNSSETFPPIIDNNVSLMMKTEEYLYSEFSKIRIERGEKHTS